MRSLGAVLLILTFLWLLGRAYDAEYATGQPIPSHARIGDGSLIRAIRHERIQTWRCQNAIDRPRSPVSYAAERSTSLEFRKWVHELWQNRADFHCALARQLTDPVRAIHAVFGADGAAAVAVARCESHLNIHARNGQFHNLFQMGYAERRLYGWHTAGSPALVAARAAYRYFVASGRDWSPWACRP